MLMRTDPFRELDRLAQQVLGTSARPASMPMDAYRTGDEFVVEFDLPGVDASSIDLTVEKNVLTVHAQRSRTHGDDVELIAGERPQGTFSRQLFLGEALDSERLSARYNERIGAFTRRVNSDRVACALKRINIVHDACRRGEIRSAINRHYR